jgi:hypothetical protein
MDFEIFCIEVREKAENWEFVDVGNPFSEKELLILRNVFNTNTNFRGPKIPRNELIALALGAVTDWAV